MPAAACCFAALELGRRERAGRSGDASARGRLRRPGGARTCCSRWSARLGSRASWARCAAGPRCGTAATASRAWCDAATGGARAGAQARVRCFDRHAHVCLLCVRSSDNERTSLAAPYQGKSALHIVVFVHTLMKYLTLPQEHCLWVVSLQDIRCCVIHSTAPSEQPPHSAGDPKEARQNQGGAQHHQRRGRRAAQPGRVREDEPPAGACFCLTAATVLLCYELMKVERSGTAMVTLADARNASTKPGSVGGDLLVLLSGVAYAVRAPRLRSPPTSLVAAPSLLRARSACCVSGLPAAGGGNGPRARAPGVHRGHPHDAARRRQRVHDAVLRLFGRAQRGLPGARAAGPAAGRARQRPDPLLARAAADRVQGCAPLGGWPFIGRLLAPPQAGELP